MKSEIEQELARLRKAHEALRTRTRALLDANPDLIFRLDREGRYLDFHAADTESLALRPSEFLGRKHSELFEPSFAEASMRCIAAALDTGQTQTMEYPLDVRNETRQYESRIVPAGDDEVIVIVRDITESKRAIDQLRLAEFRLNEAQRIAKIGSWERDLATNEVWWSPEIYRLLELDSEETAPSFAVFLNLVHPDDRSNVMARVAESERSGEPYVSYHRVVLPSGTVRTFYDRAFVVFDTAGRPARLVGTVQDISEQIELENEIAAMQSGGRSRSDSVPQPREDALEGLGHALTGLSIGLAALVEKIGKSHSEQRDTLARLERAIGVTPPGGQAASVDSPIRIRLRRRGPSEPADDCPACRTRFSADRHRPARSQGLVGRKRGA